MRKLVAIGMGIALMAGAAQADLIASWTGANDGTVVNAPGTGVVVSDLSLIGTAANTSTSGDTWGMNNLHNAGSGFQFTIVSIEDGQWIAGATVSGTARSSATGPAQMNWFVNGDAVAGESITGIGTSDTSWANTLGRLDAGDVVSLRVDLDAGTNRSGTDEAVGSGGTWRIRQEDVGDGAFELRGDVIPEPGTLGLLAMGALGLLAVRRRMK